MSDEKNPSAPVVTPEPIKVADAPATTPAATVPDAEVYAILQKAAQIDWSQADIDLPHNGFVCGTNARIDAAIAEVTCDCGAELVIDCDGQSRSKCHQCGRIFRHVVLVQDEAAMPSTAAQLLEELFVEMGIRPRTQV